MSIEERLAAIEHTLRKKDVYICDKSIEGIYLKPEHKLVNYRAYDGVVYDYGNDGVKIHYSRVLDLKQRAIAYHTDSKQFVLDTYKMASNALNNSKSDIVIIDGREFRDFYDNDLVISIHKSDDGYKLKYNSGDRIITLKYTNFDDLVTHAKKVIYDYVDSVTSVKVNSVKVDSTNAESTLTNDKIAELTKLLDEEKEESARLQDDLDMTCSDLSSVERNLDEVTKQLAEKTAELEALTAKFNSLTSLIRKEINL